MNCDLAGERKRNNEVLLATKSFAKEMVVEHWG